MRKAKNAPRAAIALAAGLVVLGFGGKARAEQYTLVGTIGASPNDRFGVFGSAVQAGATVTVNLDIDRSGEVNAFELGDRALGLASMSVTIGTVTVPGLGGGVINMHSDGTTTTLTVVETLLAINGRITSSDASFAIVFVGPSHATGPGGAADTAIPALEFGEWSSVSFDQQSIRDQIFLATDYTGSVSSITSGASTDLASALTSDVQSLQTDIQNAQTNVVTYLRGGENTVTLSTISDAVGAANSAIGNLAGATPGMTVSQVDADVTGLSSLLTGDYNSIVGNLGDPTHPSTSGGLAGLINSVASAVGGLSTANLDVPVSTRASSIQVDILEQITIETSLARKDPQTAILGFPAPEGKLTIVHDIVNGAFANAQQLGFPVSQQASTTLAAANKAWAIGPYVGPNSALALYGQAYRQLMGD
jgi:hypothetical protein